MTREQYLQEYVSPYKVWADKAQAADKREPTDTRQELGWGVEKPPHWLFNWWQNRTDKRLADIEARLSWIEKQS